MSEDLENKNDQPQEEPSKEQPPKADASKAEETNVEPAAEEQPKVEESASDKAVEKPAEKKVEDKTVDAPKEKPVVKKPIKKVAKKEVEEEEVGFSSPENEVLANLITGWMPGLEATEKESEFVNIICKPEQLHELALRLRNNEKTQFDYLFCLTGVDWPAHMTVVYHLKSTTLNHSIVLKVNTPDRENTKVDTVCDIWATAELHEREVYDLLGIEFNNHPDLRRLFLEEDWEGYPLRKDYVDEVNIVPY